MSTPDISCLSAWVYHSTAKEFSRESAGDRNRMSREDRDPPQNALGLMENAELSQYRAAVVIDFFSGQLVIVVERIHPAERELYSPPCCRKATPRSEVSSANYYFHENGVIRHMAALYVDLQVRHCVHQLLVKLADAIPALIVFAPRLIIVARTIAEGAENTFQVMLVLKSDVVLNQSDTRQYSVVWNRRGCHIHLRSRDDIRTKPSPRYYHRPNTVFLPELRQSDFPRLAGGTIPFIRKYSIIWP